MKTRKRKSGRWRIEMSDEVDGMVWDGMGGEKGLSEQIPLST